MSDTMNPTMVNSKGEGARTVEPAMETKEMPIDAIENYYEFPSSQNKAYETYSTRIEALSSALGNKDSVKG